MFFGIVTTFAIWPNFVIVRILALRSQPVGEQPRSQDKVKTSDQHSDTYF